MSQFSSELYRQALARLVAVTEQGKVAPDEWRAVLGVIQKASGGFTADEAEMFLKNLNELGWVVTRG